MASGIKTYNYAINVDPDGKKVETFAHKRQREGWWVGVVTSVTFPHATPASMYAQNVSRGDYQDLGRDLLGLPSISNPKPLLGMDLVIGNRCIYDSQDRRCNRAEKSRLEFREREYLPHRTRSAKD